MAILITGCFAHFHFALVVAACPVKQYLDKVPTSLGDALKFEVKIPLFGVINLMSKGQSFYSVLLTGMVIAQHTKIVPTYSVHNCCSALTGLQYKR